MKGIRRSWESLEELEPLQDRLGYRFQDAGLLACALTHASARVAARESNERLEFLGDAVLGAVISLELFARHPEHQEGMLTRMRSSLVSRKNLARLADRLELGRWIVTSRMFQHRQGTPASVGSNAMEAVFGAIYLDGGMDALYGVALRLLKQDLDGVATRSEQRDDKSRLSQWAQVRQQVTPSYELLSQAGPDHRATFEVRAVIQDRVFPPAWGRSKKEAERRAARAALEELGELEAPDPVS